VLTPATDPNSQQTAGDTSQPSSTTPPTTVPMSTGLLGSVVDQLPDGFNLEQATPVFIMDGNPEAVAIEYLESRFVLYGVAITQVEEEDGYTLVQWAWGRLVDESELEDGETGWLVMRPTAGGLEILAATTDGVDLSDLAVTDGSLRGLVQSNNGQEVGVDVLNLDGTPVDSAPNPEGMPDADFMWGTAGAGSPPLMLDLHVSGKVLVRVNLVGGGLLSISEVVLGHGSDDGAVAEGGFDEELVDEGEEPLAWGTARESPWVLVGWHLVVPDKPTSACTGVRPVLDEDWCTIPDADGPLVIPQAFAVGNGGVVIFRTQPGVSQIRVESDLGSSLLEVHGEADGYPPTAVLATAGEPITGWLTPFDENRDPLGEPIAFSFDEYVETPAGG
jgi:hypothetical protein